MKIIEKNGVRNIYLTDQELTDVFYIIKNYGSYGLIPEREIKKVKDLMGKMMGISLTGYDNVFGWIRSINEIEDLSKNVSKNVSKNEITQPGALCLCGHQYRHHETVRSVGCRFYIVTTDPGGYCPCEKFTGVSK